MKNLKRRGIARAELNWGLLGMVVCVVVLAGSSIYCQDAELQTPEQRERTLSSFRVVDARHPLYEMRFFGDYRADLPRDVARQESPFGCSLFVAYGANGKGPGIVGRNFDWQYHPALVLHTQPSDGYASISLVDISYLGYGLKDRKLETVDGRQSLLQAPLLPFDGMNEEGLCVAMAAVQPTQLPFDDSRPTIGSLQVIRLMLDRARTTDEAIKVFDEYNIVPGGGPPLHYLVADAEGHSAVIELKDGRVEVLRNATNWQSATNFYLAGQANPAGVCPRYAKIEQRMRDLRGTLDIDQAFALLKNVAQRHTQWSAVYDQADGGLVVAVGRRFNRRYSFAVSPRSGLGDH